jgi:hypothetical protein
MNSGELPAVGETKSGKFLRNFFYTSLRMLLGFFANLGRTCEGFAKKGKRCLCSVQKKVGSIIRKAKQKATLFRVWPI